MSALKGRNGGPCTYRPANVAESVNSRVTETPVLKNKVEKHCRRHLPLTTTNHKLMYRVFQRSDALF